MDGRLAARLHTEKQGGPEDEAGPADDMLIVG